MRLPLKILPVISALAILLSGCAAKIKLALAGSFVQDVAQATARHDDLSLATQAAPTYLLLLEGLLTSNPHEPRLLMATAQAYTAYATLIEWEEPERARALYHRAKTYGLKALSSKKKVAPLLDAPYAEFAQITAHLGKGDIPLAFWAASSWGAWISVSTGSMSALADLPKVILLMEWVLEQDETFQFGSPHLFLGLYHAALPPALGGQPEQARLHFERALEISEGKSLMPLVLMAKYYARQIFDRELYVSLLHQALDTPVDAIPELTLQNVAAQRQARQLLEETDEFF